MHFLLWKGKLFVERIWVPKSLQAPESPSWWHQLAAVLGGSCWLLTAAPCWGTVLRGGEVPPHLGGWPFPDMHNSTIGWTLGYKSPSSWPQRRKTPQGFMLQSPLSVVQMKVRLCLDHTHLSLALLCSRVPYCRTAVSEAMPQSRTQTLASGSASSEPNVSISLLLLLAVF